MLRSLGLRSMEFFSTLGEPILKHSNIQFSFGTTASWYLSSIQKFSTVILLNIISAITFKT